MSDLLRSAIHGRISKLPQLPPAAEGDEDEEGDETGHSLGFLPSGLGPPAMPAQSHRRRTQKRTPNPALSPLSGSAFFSEAVQVAVPASGLDVRAYYTPAVIPAAGSTPGVSAGAGSLMVCHHGAGFSALTFACLAKEVADMTRGECGVLAIDARRHGRTTAMTDPQPGVPAPDDLSTDVMAADLVNVLRVLFPDPAAAPTFVLVGHSMGGAVAVRACPLLLVARYRVAGVAVLDVVEGTALDALPHMNSILNARPDGFDSPEDAVEWHLSTGAIKNLTSARISVPSIVAPADPTVADALGARAYEWRTPLRATAPYWADWFTGLSAAFLAVRTARLLVLAGTDRLDRTLMIGQMQGKFQTAVVPGVGHMLHEDDPTRVAEILVEFWRRNERVGAGVKKVGEL